MARVRVVVLLSGAILVSAACAAAPPPSGGSPIPSFAVPASINLVPSPSVAVASPEPSSPPTDGPPAFTLATPPPAASTWTGIAWRKLAADDPIGQIRSVLRWSDGYVAVGAVVPDGATSRTPVWISSDGAAWQALPAGTFGPDAVVLGVVETPSTLIGLTMTGGANACGGETSPMNCWTLTPPLRSWTSSDGRAWTAHPGPDVTLTPISDGSPGVDPPIIVGGRPGALVAADGATGAHASVSQDGVSWVPSAQVAIPTIWGFYDNAAAFGDRFVAVGRSPDETGHGVAITSSDGSAWGRRSLPTTGFRPGWLGKGVGFRASRLVAGPAGLIAVGGAFVTPGAELWWSSLDGRTWQTMPTYGPLGVWVGPAEGSGITPNGVLAGNGERLIAYRADGKDAAWTSFDGRTWHRLALSGGNLPPPDRDPVIMPGGILWSGNDGSTWLGTPST